MLANFDPSIISWKEKAYKT